MLKSRTKRDPRPTGSLESVTIEPYLPRLWYFRMSPAKWPFRLVAGDDVLVRSPPAVHGSRDYNDHGSTFPPAIALVPGAGPSVVRTTGNRNRAACQEVLLAFRFPRPEPVWSSPIRVIRERPRTLVTNGSWKRPPPSVGVGLGVIFL